MASKSKEIYDRGMQAGKQEGKHEREIEMALKMIARGKLTLEEIAEDSGLPLSKIQELANGISA